MLPSDLPTQTALLHATYGAAAGVLVSGGVYLWRDPEYLSWRWRNRNEPSPAKYLPDESTYRSDPPPDEDERRKLPLNLAKSAAIFAVLAVGYLDGADWLFPAALAIFGLTAAAKILFGDGAGVMEVGAGPAGFKPRRTLRQRLRLAASELTAVAAAAFGWITSLRSRDEAGPETELGWLTTVDSHWFLLILGVCMMAGSALTLTGIFSADKPEDDEYEETRWSTIDEHPKLGEVIAATVIFLIGTSMFVSSALSF